MRAMVSNEIDNEVGKKAPGYLRAKEEFDKVKDQLGLDEEILFNMNEQMLLCKPFETEKILEFCEEEAFWKYLQELNFV